MTKQGLIRSNENSFGVLYRVIDLSIILMTLFVCVIGYEITPHVGYLTAGLIASMSYLLVAESLEVYRSWRAATALRMITVTSSAWVLVATGLIVLAFFAKVSEDFSRLVMGTWMVGALVFLSTWRLIFRLFLKEIRLRGYNTRRVAIVGVNEAAIEMRRQIDRSPELGYQFWGFFDDRCDERIMAEYDDVELMGTIDELIHLTQSGKFEVIFIALPLKAQVRIAEILEKCGDTTASVHLIPDFFTYNLLH
ncbi:MAG: undecaprenyl-phosphate glucose phosphotransferase, partial [Pseudomonadota bacterium]|nr:undecaprenyl-phosphate glucose phosphotransferase [Pseudomonadota bacterium]